MQANLQRSLSIREKILGARHSDVAPALESLGWIQPHFFFDSKYIEAEPLFQRSLQIWTAATKEPTNPLIAQALDALGSDLFRAETLWADAEPFFRKAAGDSGDRKILRAFRIWGSFMRR